MARFILSPARPTSATATSGGFPACDAPPDELPDDEFPGDQLPEDDLPGDVRLGDVQLADAKLGEVQLGDLLPGHVPAVQAATLLAAVDGDGRITWANDPGRRLLRLPPEPDRPRFMDLVHHEHRGTLGRMLTHARTTGRAECVVQAGGGPAAQARHLSLLCSPLAGPGPDPGLLVQGWDVSNLVRRLRRLELHVDRDPLTGLPNRAAFRQTLRAELRRASRQGSRVAVLFADLDDFKQVNDRHGHEAGDAVLQGTARRLAAELRPGDLLARIGGDEFAAVCPLTGQDGPAALTDRLRRAAARPLPVHGMALRVTVSLGMAIGDGTDPALDADRLLRRADEAMYACKRARGA